MKKILIIFSVLFALLLREECHGQGTVKYTAGISYGYGDPTYTPNGNVSKRYINLTTLRSSTYSGTAWVLDGRGIDVVSGCAAPAYTPGPGQSNIVINNCTLFQNGQGPELYVFDGVSWIFINEKNTAPTYTAGTGIDITGTVISNTGDLSNTNEIQNLSLSGQTLGISSGNTVTIPLVAVSAGTGISVSNSSGTATVTNTAPDQVVSITGGGINAVTGTYPNFTVTGTEVDGSVTNELQTISTGTNTLTLSNSGGTVTVDTDPTNDITSLSGGTGISISGSGNSRTITNTGDLSDTNELQTLSISNDTISISDGNSVVLPGGGVTWPLRGPDGSADAPTYSFESDTMAGMFQGSNGLTIQGGVIIVKAFDGYDGGSFLMSSGEGLSNSGGEFRLSAGGSSVSDGGQFNLNAGNSDVANGGQFSMSAGNGVTGGSFTMNAGSGELGGAFGMYAGSSSLPGFTGGGIGMYSGYGDAGGRVSISSSDGDTGGGNIFIVCGGGNDIGGKIDIIAGPGYGGASTGGDLNIVGGEGTTGGNVNISGGAFAGLPTRENIKIDYAIEYTPITSTLRDSNAPTAGKTIFCSNCTANDSSTGVLQTYNGSTWKNHW